MKKRLLSALLALALVFVLLPTTALAEVTTGDDYDISINGRGWKFEKDTTSGAYIPVYYYHTGVFDNANNKNRTNDNLELTKEGNTVTITIRRGTSHDYRVYPIEFTLEKISTTSGSPYDFTPCIEMGNDNNLVITGKGTLNITRNENKSYGAALYSNVGDITINGGITVNVSFLNGKDYYNKNVSSNAIYVGDNHNLTVSGSGTNVIATNQGFHSSPATVCVEGGTITVSGGASLSATNTYADNFSGSSVTQHFKSYAISGTESKPCTLIVADEKSSVTAWAYDEKYGKPFGFVTYNITGATVKAGSDAYYATETTIDNINGNEYVKISIPALQRTSDVLIAKENAVVGQWTNIQADTGTGSYSYDADKKELTLKDVNIASSSIINGIQFTKDGTYTINLVGTNTMSGFSTGISANSADQYVSNINITITGAGSLEVSTTSYAIAMNKGNLKFENTGEIKLTTSNISKKYNVLSVSGVISITDMEKYKVEGIVQDNTKDGGDTVTLSEASHLKGYQNPDGTAICLKTITITPAAAKDSTIRYNGKTLKQGETIKDGNGGTATVDSKNNTITLKNFNGTALSFDATLADSTLVLEGTSTLSSIVTTQKGLTISGSGSLTVGSIKVHNQKDDKPNLTINGATVTVGTAELTTRAIDIDGDLTVTNGSLTATSKSDSVPTVQVGGNASFTGSTVTITNNSTTQGEQYKDSNAASSALHVNGAVTISGGTVTAEAKAGGDAIRAVGNITVSNDAIVTAKNNSQYFNAITAGKATGGEVNTLYNLIVSGENTCITATNTHDNNLTYGGAINAYIKNANEGHYLQVGTDTKAIAPNVNTTVRNNSLTITRGDAYTTPQVAANYTIAGQTMYVGKYYKTDASGNITEGTAQDYNIFCDSENDFTLNNATISSTGTDVAINTNIRYETNVQHHIKLIGTNRINNTFKHAISAGSNSSTIIIEGVGNASDASLTINGNFLPIYSDGKVIINAEVVIVNTTDDNSFKGLISTSDGKGAFDLGSGYKCYASTSTTGTPLEEFNSANYSTYKYLRVTKENLAPTTPTTYTVTITAGDNMKHESGALTQEVTKGAAITEVKFMAASGHYFPADYVSKMNLPAGLTAEIRENSWYLIISGTPTSDVTINLPAASVRPTITVSMPTPAAGNTPATASDITLTYSDINKSISKNLTISNVVWQSYVSNGDGSITPGNTLSSGDKFVEGTEYYVTIDFEGVSENYAIVPAADTTAWRNAEWGSRTMTLYFNVTGAPCNHEYTNDWLANGNTHWHECKLCRAHAGEVAHTFGDWITDTPATDTTDGSKHRTCSVCQYQENATIPKTGTGEIVPPTPDNPGTIVIIRPAEEEKPAQQPNPSTGANDLVGLAVAAAVAAALGSAALLRKHD